MRFVLIIAGLIAIGTYAAYGAFAITHWAVTAASELPLDVTIAEMQAANQPYSALPGFIFAGAGIVLAGAWALASHIPRFRVTPWASVSLWALILTLGAPAYFWLSFGNLNSIGDTFYEWNSGAAFAVALPLYGLSLLALPVAIGAFILAVLTPRTPASRRR